MSEKLLGDYGEFHATDEAVDLSGITFEAWIALGIFWLLGLTVLYQFITSYVLNDSAAWTEEIARYLLIGVVFVGAAIGVIKNNHIQVDFFLPPHATCDVPRTWHHSRCAANTFLWGGCRDDRSDDDQDGQQRQHDSY